MISHEELLEKNLVALAKTQPRLAGELRKHLDEILGGKLPQPLLKETSSGHWIKGLGESPFFQKDENFDFKRAKAPVYLLFGLGYPPYLFRILRALPQEALAVLVVEPSLEALLFTLSRTSVFQALPQGCRICFLVEDRHALLDEALLWTLVPMGIFPAKNLHLIVHPGQAEAVPQLRSLGEALRKEILYRLSLLGNSPEDTLLGFRHAVLNTRRILESPSMEDLKKIFGGRSFVCVATGPSLEKNVDLLKGLENKCIITACDTALLPLLKRGIRPHVVTTIERPYNMYRIWVQKVLREFPEECSHILLISQSVSYPMTAGRWPGPHMVIGKQEVPVDNWYTGSILGKNLLYSGLSVAHMNLTFAFATGASSVALLGQDLAYDSQGDTHVSEAVTEAVRAKDKARKRMTVPGALGGVVETHTVWFLFLQVFERILEVTQKEVYDCTEGGALIRGTIICPFREYIHAHLSEPAEEPLVLSSSDFPAPSEEEMREHKEKVLSLLGRNMEYITSCHGILDKMENLVAAACAPGLSPQRRQQSAYEVAGLLDDLHAANPVLSFIGQSYTHLAGAVMAETRMLDSVPSIERWKKLHREIIASHRANVRFLEQWLTYAADLLSPSEAFAVAEGELPEESRITEMFGQLDTLPEREERRKFVTELSDLLCRADPLEQEVSPEYLWSLGRFMISLGRAEDACRYMEKAYALWEGKERSSALIASFFREWGIMAGTHDLCRQPEYQKALELLRTAQTYAPEDESLEELLREFYQRYFDHLQNVRTLAIKGTSGDLEIQIWALRSRAEEALLRKDLPEAMKTARQIIEIAQDSFLTPPYVSWLGNTAFQCLQAADPVVKAASEEALAWLAENASRFVGEGVLFSSDLVAYLQKKGLKLGAETSDTGKKNEDITENRG